MLNTEILVLPKLEVEWSVPGLPQVYPTLELFSLCWEPILVLKWELVPSKPPLSPLWASCTTTSSR
jgi:hypothetical protein